MPRQDSESPIAQMRRIVQAHSRLFARETTAAGVTRQQFVVMRALLANPTATQVEIQRATAIDRSTVSQIMEGLRAKGFARSSRREDDMRANAVILTREGIRACQKVQANFAHAETVLLAVLTSAAQNRLGAMLKGIIANFDQKEQRHARSAASDH